MRGRGRASAGRQHHGSTERLHPERPVQATSEDVAQPGGRPEGGVRMLGGHPRLDQTPDETVGAPGPYVEAVAVLARVKTPL